MPAAHPPASRTGHERDQYLAELLAAAPPFTDDQAASIRAIAAHPGPALPESRESA